MQLKSFLEIVIVNFPHPLLMRNLSTYNADKIVFILFNTSSGFF